MMGKAFNSCILIWWADHQALYTLHWCWWGLSSCLAPWLWLSRQSWINHLVKFNSWRNINWSASQLSCIKVLFEHWEHSLVQTLSWPRGTPPGASSHAFGLFYCYHILFSGRTIQHFLSILLFASFLPCFAQKIQSTSGFTAVAYSIIPLLIFGICTSSVAHS